MKTTDVTFIAAAFDRFVDVRIGDWIRVVPERLQHLFACNGTGSVVLRDLGTRTLPLYYRVSTGELTDRIPLEFGGSDWEPVVDASTGAVVGFRNTFDARESQDPSVMDPPVLSDAAAHLEKQVQKKVCDDEAAARALSQRELLARARVARGLDPVFGNPLK